MAPPNRQQFLAIVSVPARYMGLLGLQKDSGGPLYRTSLPLAGEGICAHPNLMALPPALVNSLSQGKIELSVPLKPEPWLAQLGWTEDLLFMPWPWGFLGGKPSRTAHPGSVQQQLQGLPILGFHQTEEAGLVLCRVVTDVALGEQTGKSRPPLTPPLFLLPKPTHALSVKQHSPAVVALKWSHQDGRHVLNHIH